MSDNGITITDLGDVLALAVPLLKRRDENAWELGDIVGKAVSVLDIEVKPGRKKADDETMTLGDLAAALNQATPRVSEWYNCAALYPPEKRPHNLRTHEDLTWGHYNLARRKANGDLHTAMNLLDTAVYLHLNYSAFKRWLNGEIWEGYLDYNELPKQVQPFATKPQVMVWATFKYQQPD